MSKSAYGAKLGWSGASPREMGSSGAAYGVRHSLVVQHLVEELVFDIRSEHLELCVSRTK